MPGKKRVLVVGGGFSGLLVARDLRSDYDVTVVDAKEYFEYTPGILRAYVKPSHFKHLTFVLQPVIEGKMGCRFMWGEVMNLDGDNLKATIRPMMTGVDEEISFDHCVIASGCNFGPFNKHGESLWFPVIHNSIRSDVPWKHIDERFIEGRRAHILEENAKLKALNDRSATVLVVGAGFIGVEWATELQHYFPNLKITIIDFLSRCLGPLPEKAAKYCDNYMKKKGIKTFYNVKYDPESPNFWAGIEMPSKADIQYVCIGVKASNFFMPKETLSDKGPGGGGWILMNKKLQVTNKEGAVWGQGKVYAVGDCNYGCIGSPPNWVMPPVPKISYPGEEQASHVVKFIQHADHGSYGGWMHCYPTFTENFDTFWPWGAGMFATSLGPKDGCFVFGASDVKESGYLAPWVGRLSALQKEFIEMTKVWECQDGFMGKCVWHLVHHTPYHFWGKAPAVSF